MANPMEVDQSKAEAVGPTYAWLFHLFTEIREKNGTKRQPE